MSTHKQLYETIPAGYHYYASKRGNIPQRFWHKHKNSKIRGQMELKGKDILDIGCGSGVFLSTLPEIYKQAIGIDISRTQISFAKRKFKNKRKIKWQTKDIRNIDFQKGSYDYIIISEVIEHITQKESMEMLRKAKILLKRNGHIILTTPNYLSLWVLIEIVWNKINKISHKKQHINQQTINKMEILLNKVGFTKIKIETFFIISPFISILSERLGEFIMKIEKLFPRFGSIIMIKT